MCKNDLLSHEKMLDVTAQKKEAKSTNRGTYRRISAGCNRLILLILRDVTQ